MTQSPTLMRACSPTRSACRSRSATVPESASLGCAILAAVGVGAASRASRAAVAAMTRTRVGRARVRARRRTTTSATARWREVYDTLQTWTMLTVIRGVALRPRRRARRHRAAPVGGLPRACSLEFGVDVGLEEYRRHLIAPGGGPEYACRTYAPAASRRTSCARGRRRVYLALLRDGRRARCPGARAALERLRGDASARGRHQQRRASRST